MMRIGLISDTHGLLRPEALAFLRGSDRIIHGGDIGNPGILEALGAIAPVTAVRGNVDTATWAAGLPAAAILAAEDVRVYIVHDRSDLAREPAPAGARVVVSGHSHQPGVAWRGGVLYVNPGSAGRRRFKLPVSVGEIRVDGAAVSARTVALELPAKT